MSIYRDWYESELREDAQRDARDGLKDYEYYQPCSDDPYKQAYTEEYDRAVRQQEERAKERSRGQQR